MQLPTVFFTMADNQENDVIAFTETGLMEYAGDIRSDRAGTIARVIALTERLVGDAKRRDEMIELMKHTVDGKGAWRIATEIRDGSCG